MYIHDLAPNSIKMRHMIFFLQLLWALFSLSNWIRGGEILMDFLRGSSHLLVCWFLMMIWNMNMKNGIFLRFMYIRYSKNVLFLLKKCITNDEYEVIQIRQCEIFLGNSWHSFISSVITMIFRYLLGPVFLVLKVGITCHSLTCNWLTFHFQEKISIELPNLARNQIRIIFQKMTS